MIATVVSLAVLLLFATFERGCSISCYTCSSVNGTDPHCHDPFHPAYARYTSDCMVPKDGHIGRFPAHFCVKLVGRTVDTNSELIIRVCSLENMDNSCGAFRYQEDIMQGCILTCNYDGCNSAQTLLQPFWLVALLLLCLILCLTDISLISYKT